jgi:hypothetical protein
VWITREIEPLVLRRASQRPVVLITGARQTGKTSLARRLFPGCELVSLDLPSEAEQAEHDPREFLRRHPPPLVIDEVQYAPRLFRHLKVVIDADRDRNGQFVLTGSQKLVLMQSVSESLAGRADVIELEGLSYSEILGAGLKYEPEAVLVRGGFPELYAKPDLDPAGFYRSYLATYLERDVRQLLRVGSLRDYQRFVRACALRTAQLLNRAELARDVGIAGSTAAQWLSVLQASGQVVLLEPWFSNRTKSLVKTAKLHLADTGLAAFLVGIEGPDDLGRSPLVGPLWETLVCAELRRRLLARHGGWDFFYWRDRSREADFLFHRGGRFDLADAKWTEHPGPGDTQSLARIAADLPRDRVERLALVCRCPNAYPVGSGVEAMPLDAVAGLLGPAVGDR